MAKRDLYELVSNKYSFGELCRNHDFLVSSELSSDCKRFPFVAKQRTYTSSRKNQLKPYLIFNENGFDQFMDAETVVDFYLLFYISKKGRVSTLSQENLILQSCGRAVVAVKLSTVHTEKNTENYANTFKK
ncbi:MAG: hypothetical protein GY941_08700 [Planctomycetes bacterium]|nr:hypothetical protein [Planctomycetota bacterium]